MLHRVEARLEFTFKIKAEGKKRHMLTAVLTKSVFDAAGGTMGGIEGVHLSNYRHGKVNLRCNGVTCIWVSDNSPKTETPSQFVELLVKALSTHGDIPVVCGCFSSIRLKLGSPSKFQVTTVPPLLT